MKDSVWKAGWKGTYPCELAISKGVVVGEKHGNLTFDEMKELADKRMYEDKDAYYRRKGRGKSDYRN